MILNVNATNFIPYVATGGFKWERKDIEGSNKGTTITGKKIRDKISTKVSLKIQLRPMTTEELNLVLPLLDNEYVAVDYIDPMEGLRQNITMFCESTPATYLIEKNGVEYWSGVNFTLEER